MRLLRTRIKGFQSFADSGVVEFHDGINLLVGQNNAGKSAFLRALKPNLTDDRHRNPDRYREHLLSVPEVHLAIEMSGSELLDALLRCGSQISVPVSAPDSARVNQELAIIFAAPLILFELIHRPNTVFASAGVNWYTRFIPRATCTANIGPNNGSFSVLQMLANVADGVPTLVHQTWQRDMFFFTAERFAIGESPFANAERLEPNAANLPAVLDTLSGSRGLVFRKLVEHLREVFPTIGNLSVRPLPGTNANEIRVWPTEDMSRVELSFPLSQSGTGVAQAIALLTAIMTIDRAVIMVDEISSFLHPAAVKSLLRIIQSQYSHHQYIISTHAPEVISFSNPRTIHLIRRTGYDSNVKKLNLDQVDTFREVASHLGVSMSDVFAAERIIWVEGPTEELCFPYLYSACCGGLPQGMLMTSVAATGDFNRSRDPKIVYEIYQRLSAASSSLTISVAFSLDTEKLTEAQKNKMRHDSGGLLHFLPRRNFECYLLDPEAIAAFISFKDRASTISAAAVADQLRLSARDIDLNIVPQWDNDLENEDWLAAVDGATLITRVCNALSENRAPFSKNHDSLKLLKHIVENRVERLTSLIAYVRSLVEGVA